MTVYPNPVFFSTFSPAVSQPASTVAQVKLSHASVLVPPETSEHVPVTEHIKYP